ncbi:hypothetical protein TSUD_402090 [Trifolium subterraneum]|uniref:Reverse transcriptase zinc-binding domain-containing protein n=1 Tax=Trifolium subterraneum TaxID=3900 RepID=A0A2Z6PB81_TRISU|nr:hypothetical protein TSUD_402090 [Trifolium subterraneum]
MLVGVNIHDSWLSETASALRCKVGKIPFIYLGLSVEGDPRCLGFWEPVLSRLKKWLSGWKIRFLSFCGRLILIKSVLISLPVNAHSFFKAPSAEGRRGSSWWREILRIRDNGGGTAGAWFGECISKKVGDGSDTLFWTDPWVYGIPLCERFGRLFDLAETQSCTVAEMALLGWEVGGEAWVRRRQLRGWEKELLGECQTLLLNITFQDQVTLNAAEGLIWHSQVPLKVSILAWRLLCNRLPTKANLVIRGILSSEAHFCVSGCGAAESTQHLFISCSTFGSIWSLLVLGLDLHWWILTLFRTSLLSLLFQQESPGCVVLLCNLYGLLACGLCGTSGTLDVSKAQQIRYSKC